MNIHPHVSRSLIAVQRVEAIDDLRVQDCVHLQLMLTVVHEFFDILISIVSVKRFVKLPLS